MLPLLGRCQVYSFSALGTAQCQLAVMDWSDYSAGAASWISVNTLNETVYYDPIAQTVRQVGSVSLNAPTDVTLSFNDVQVVGGNPQTATVAVDFSLPSILSFDSGVEPLNDGNAQFTPPSILLTGNYSILANNQTLTGSFGYSLDFQTSLTEVSDVTPTSLVISQSPSYYDFSAPEIASGITAANDMVFNLVGGISDGTYLSTWSLGPVTAAAVPEPGSPLLFSIGLLVFGLSAAHCRIRKVMKFAAVAAAGKPENRLPNT